MSEKRYYMACLDLSGRDVLVVGAGSVAREKIEGLLDAGARVTVVAPDVSEPVEALARSRRLSLIRRPYRTEDLEGRFLVVAATSITPVNERVYADAEHAGCCATSSTCPSSAASSSPRSTATTRSRSRSRRAARHPRSPSGCATTSLGSSHREHVRLARDLRELRPWAKEHLPTYEARRDFFRELVEERLG